MVRSHYLGYNVGVMAVLR